MRYKVTVQTVINLDATDFQDAASKAVATVAAMSYENADTRITSSDTKRVEQIT